MFLKGHYQNAYVTHDLDRALAQLRKQFALPECLVFEPEMVLKTPAGEKVSKVRAALAWVDTLQFEFIEPVSGYIDYYLDIMPKDKSDASLRFHHIAVRRDDLDAMREEIAQLGLPVVFEGSVAGLTFIYLDARATLGHYFEYVWATPDGWDIIGWPKGRAA